MAPGARDVRFGHYRLVERIGAGGMAEVHRAVAEGPGGFARTVVIKRMLPQLCDDDAFVRMLLAEGRLTALLHHPSIVQLYEVGEVDGVFYLAMEHVDGVDLSSLMRAALARLPLPPPVACAIACELAGALAYAHARTDDGGAPCAIVHRDVSPANIMITAAGTVKLLDFGIAKAADSLRDVETRTGTLKGKAAYMSPEQAEGEPIDRRTDVFALGVVLHEMLTLRRLFRGDDDLQTLKRVRACDVAPPSTLRAGIDGELDAVVMKMLARRADDRFGSCDEVLAALTPVARRLHGDATAVRAYLDALGPVERIVRRAPAPAARDTATFDLAPPGRRDAGRASPRPRTTTIAAAGSAAVVVAATALWMAHVRRVPSPAAAPPPAAQSIARAPRAVPAVAPAPPTLAPPSPAVAPPAVAPPRAPNAAPH
ncbi:MAG: serine/threonine protein kinase, partial [Myxococcales bacterium]|nr:serine/threonine protein kinase [Myxococcales bacterium]